MPKIRLQSSDGEILETDSTITKFSDTIKRMLKDCGAEKDDDALILVENVSGAILRMVLEYADHYKNDEQPVEDDETNAQNDKEPVEDDETANKRVIEISQWDENFLKVDQPTLMELILAANFLNIKGLMDKACKTVANMMTGKSPDELCRAFNILKDFDDNKNERIRGENDWSEESEGSEESEDSEESEGS